MTVGWSPEGSSRPLDTSPYLLEYELTVADNWTTTHLIAHAEGAGWTRDLALTRANGQWSCRGSAQGATRLQAWDGQALLDPAPPGFRTAPAVQRSHRHRYRRLTTDQRLSQCTV